MNNFKVFLSKSEDMRNGYIKSLDNVDLNFKDKWLEHFELIPNFFEEIYSVCNGTKLEISEQIFFDFLPGFRLMQVDEVIEKYEKEYKNCSEFDKVIPFLADNAGCYYAYARKKDIECIILASYEGMEIIHSDIYLFWKTIIAFYDEGVYFLDEDGFLSYDFEMEGDIGRRYNIGIDYWK
ncbi:MAG: hypothetical protein K2N51_13940 [Lachnospiraceae bacterium]|nr:hypothetical protein [Lachnospiraceae bacterium]